MSTYFLVQVEQAGDEHELTPEQVSEQRADHESTPEQARADTRLVRI